MDETALVAALRARERGAVDELYRRYHERVWAFLVRLCRSRQEAEDLFQETWLAAARHAHRLEPDSQLVAWLFTIARNQHRGARRFLMFDFRKRDRVQHEPLPDAPRPDVEAEQRARARALATAFDALDDAHREVLVLAVIEGLSSAEVGRVLGLREDAVRKRVSRARAELAAKMEKAEPGRRA